MQSHIALESNKIPLKKEKKHKNESTFWKYLDYTNWIPGEIEIQDEINKDYY